MARQAAGLRDEDGMAGAADTVPCLRGRPEPMGRRLAVLACAAGHLPEVSSRAGLLLLPFMVLHHGSL